MTTREMLPSRRQSQSFDFHHVNQGGHSFRYKATAGYYPDGRLGEVFLSASKITTDMDVAARDMAILLSIALQHGADREKISAAMTRQPNGKPLGVAGTLLDIIDELEGEAS